MDKSRDQFPHGKFRVAKMFLLDTQVLGLDRSSRLIHLLLLLLHHENEQTV